MQKVVNELNKTAKIYDAEISIFENKTKGFLCKNIKGAKLLTERSSWNKNNFGQFNVWGRNAIIKNRKLLYEK